MAYPMIFGYPLNSEAEVEEDDDTRTRRWFESLPYTRFFLDSESASMDSEPYPQIRYIDFFGLDSSNEVESEGELYINPNQSLGTLDYFNIWEPHYVGVANEIELGLGIGIGSGSGSGSGQLSSDPGVIWIEVPCYIETESGRVEEEEEAMVCDEVIEWPRELEEEELILPELEWDVYSHLNSVVVFQDGRIVASYDGVRDHRASGAGLDEYGEINGDNDYEIDEVINQLFEDAIPYNPRPPASKRAVEDLPVVEINEEEVFCAICKDEIVVDEKVKRLPCRHDYHGECIVPWLEIRNTCPLCRFELPTDDLDYERFKASQGQGSNASGLVSDLMSE